MRTRIVFLVLAFFSLSGCVGGALTKARDVDAFTPADEARLAELRARLDSVDLDDTRFPADSTASLAASTLSADERKALLVEVQRLQNKRAAVAAASQSRSDRRVVALVGAAACVAVLVVLVSSFDPEIPTICWSSCDD